VETGGLYRPKPTVEIQSVNNGVASGGGGNKTFRGAPINYTDLFRKRNELPFGVASPSFRVATATPGHPLDPPISSPLCFYWCRPGDPF